MVENGIGNLKQVTPHMKENEKSWLKQLVVIISHW